MTEGTSAPVYYCANELNQYDTLDDTSTCPPAGPDVVLGYDLGGNLTNKGGLTLVYNGENRLIEAYPASPANGDQKVTFAYDYQGRRVAKRVFTYAGGWPGSPDEHIKFVWHGWHLLAELDGLSSNAVLRTYAWGLDLSASVGGAGGIGGLLAVNDTTIGGGAQDYVFAYDAMGNVTQVIDWDAATINDAIVASYEYDAYGNLFAESGAYASKNRWRMSTKPFDAETGFGYWGYRYYDAGLGRWLNRDPIGEYGGTNIYACVNNAPTERWDYLGQTVGDREPWHPGCGITEDEYNREPIKCKVPVPPQAGSAAKLTDSQCCKAARPCSRGHGGGVICCGERMVSCSWIPEHGDPLTPDYSPTSCRQHNACGGGVQAYH